MADATYVSFVTFFICFGAYLNSNVGLMEFGTTLITAHLAVMYLHLAIETKSWVSLSSKYILCNIQYMYNRVGFFTKYFSKELSFIISRHFCPKHS